MHADHTTDTEQSVIKSPLLQRRAIDMQLVPHTRQQAWERCVCGVMHCGNGCLTTTGVSGRQHTQQFTRRQLPQTNVLITTSYKIKKTTYSPLWK